MYTDCIGSGRGPHRSRRGMIFGVCRGLAEQLNFSVGATRVAVLVAFFFTGFWPVGALYLLAAFLMKEEPVLAPRAECGYSYTVPVSANGLGQNLDSLDKRLQRIETVITAKAYDWDERLERG